MVQSRAKYFGNPKTLNGKATVSYFASNRNSVNRIRIGIAVLQDVQPAVERCNKNYVFKCRVQPLSKVQLQIFQCLLNSEKDFYCVSEVEGFSKSIPQAKRSYCSVSVRFERIKWTRLGYRWGQISKRSLLILVAHFCEVNGSQRTARGISMDSTKFINLFVKQVSLSLWKTLNRARINFCIPQANVAF